MITACPLSPCDSVLCEELIKSFEPVCVWCRLGVEVEVQGNLNFSRVPGEPGNNAGAGVD